jgi:SAM-dependent methyltransferase
VARTALNGSGRSLWRAQSDLVLRALVRRWLVPGQPAAILKTDLYDEVAGIGLVPFLQRTGYGVTAIDISDAAVEAAGARYGALSARIADVRSLPFADSSFDAVISNSTLDHLDGPAGVERALRELSRVLRPGGRLLITMDNPRHPMVALREAIPAEISRRLRAVEYEAGWTCGPARLETMLDAAGFRVRDRTAVVHGPRVVLAALDRLPFELDSRLALRGAVAVERAERLPTRGLTGHFIAVLASAR